MKKSLFLLLSICLLMMTGCGKNKAARENLLKTIPQNTAYVCLINLESISEDMGNSRENGKTAWGEDMKSLLNSLGDNGRQIMDFVSENKGEVNFDAAALFECEDNAVLTFKVKSGDKFADYLTSKGKKFAEKDGVKVSADGTVLVKDKQVWVTGVKCMDATSVNDFTSLKKKESFMGIKYADKMAGSDSDIDLFLDIESLTAIGGQQGAAASMTLSFLLDDLKYIAGTIDFENGEINGEFKLLNPQFEPAPLVLPLAGAKASDLKGFIGKGDIFYMISLDSKTIEAVLNQFGTMFFLDSNMQNLLNSINGPIIAALNVNGQQEETMHVAITFKDASSAQTAVGLFKSLPGIRTAENGRLSVTADGNKVYLMTPQNVGAPFTDYLSIMDGAYMGIAMQTDMLKTKTGGSVSEIIKDIAVTMNPDDKGVKLMLKSRTAPNKNALISMLQFMKLVNDGDLEMPVEKVNVQVPDYKYDELFDIPGADSTATGEDPDDDKTIEELLNEFPIEAVEVEE